MKDSDQKYNEACERNVFNFERKKPAKYLDRGLFIVKNALGVRNDDTRFDKRIEIVLKSCQIKLI